MMGLERVLTMLRQVLDATGNNQAVTETRARRSALNE